MSLLPMDKIAGCLLIATWASSVSCGFLCTPMQPNVGRKFLYMSEVYQALYYFRHFEKDDWKLKTLVTVALVVDTAATVGAYICVYLDTITYVGDLEYLSSGHWITVSAHRSSANGIAAQFFSVVGSGFMLALYPSIKDRLKLKIPALLWLVTEVTVNVSITSALLWEFRKASSILTEAKGCAIWQILYRLHSLDFLSILDRLTAVTIQSGAAAATLAVAGLIAYNIVPESNVSGGFLFPLGRVYVITLLANLNVRKSGKSLSTTVTSSESGSGTAYGEQRPLTLTGWNMDDSCGIHVHHTFHSSVQVGRLP
ncbi:hypothetical protein DFH08DRAFT_803981 [Mycena albidolilacea]|uniref:DUF6534 domain-containing protein n=1 Tax=Mycena albidolilacea TaxID=1033008 RepID=A0AAD7AB70_9AGAR|nr:hypothetical protein DFH08DRAFT_803981 [Mycena albidolilacea]